MSTAHRSDLRHSQNFLRSRRLVTRLIEASSIAADDVVLDIGAGKGIIAAALADRCRQVIAIEPDPVLARHLRQRFLPLPNVTVEQADARLAKLPVGPYKVFASLPFNVTAAIMAKLTTGTSPPDDAFLVVQREAAERYLGSPRQTLAALRLYPWFDLSVVHTFRRTDFRPMPHVDIVFLRVRRRSAPLISAVGEAHYHDLVSYCFTTWKPSLRDTLVTLIPPHHAARILRELEIADTAGPSAVGSDQWLALVSAIDRALDKQGWQTVRAAAARLCQQQATLRKCHRTAIARR